MYVSMSAYVFPLVVYANLQVEIRDDIYRLYLAHAADDKWNDARWGDLPAVATTATTRTDGVPTANRTDGAPTPTTTDGAPTTTRTDGAPTTTRTDGVPTTTRTDGVCACSRVASDCFGFIVGSRIALS